MASYWEIAEYDEADARFNLQNGRLRVGVYLCQQAAEKYLKSVLEMMSAAHERLKSHAVHNILTAIEKGQAGTSLYSEAKYLSSFYYDTRYPGDNYAEVVDLEAQKALQYLENIKAFCLATKEKFEPKINIAVESLITPNGLV